MSPVAPLLIALQFLTRVPVRLKKTPDARSVGASLCYYPLIGGLIGLALAVPHVVLADSPDLLRASVVLVTWIGITGALHLDGLADSADAWMGNNGSRERALTIMKDPRCGTAAVVAIVIALMLKFSAITVLDTSNVALLILIPALARANAVWLFATTPYVKAHGLGADLSKHASKTGGTVAVIATVLATVWLAPLVIATALLATIFAVGLLARHTMLTRLGGTTGDTAGALIEVSETTGLIAVAILV
jgi:adenosylcobinamide-GDP ribazoletransferase